MYVRRTTRRNKDGSSVTYLQLAENVWDPERGQARARVIHSLGREEEVDRKALARLVRSISRFLGSSPGGGVGTGAEAGRRPGRGDAFRAELWSELQVPAALAGAQRGGSAAEVEHGVLALVSAVLGDRGGDAPAAPTVEEARARARAIDLLADAGPAIQAAVLRSAAVRRAAAPGRAAVVMAPLSFGVGRERAPAAGRPAPEASDQTLALAATEQGFPAGAWILPDGSRRDAASVGGDLRARGISQVLWGDMTEDLDEGELPAGRWEFAPLAEGMERLRGDSLRPGRLVCRDVVEAAQDRRRRDERLTQLRAELEIVATMAAPARVRAEETLLSDGAVAPWVTRRRGRLVVDDRQVAETARRDGLFTLAWPSEDLTAAEAAELRAGAQRLRSQWAALNHTVPDGPAYRPAAERLRGYATIAFLALMLTADEMPSV